MTAFGISESSQRMTVSPAPCVPALPAHPKIDNTTSGTKTGRTQAATRKMASIDRGAMAAAAALRAVATPMGPPSRNRLTVGQRSHPRFRTSSGVTYPETMSKLAPPDAHALLARLRETIDLLEAIGRDPGVLAGVPDEERKRLLQAVALVYSPDRAERRRMSKIAARQRKASRVGQDQTTLRETGIRTLRRKPVF